LDGEEVAQFHASYQQLLVITSAITLAIESVRMILNIHDNVIVRQFSLEYEQLALKEKWLGLLSFASVCYFSLWYVHVLDCYVKEYFFLKFGYCLMFFEDIEM
jgi:hypothetical protein